MNVLEILFYGILMIATDKNAFADNCQDAPLEAPECQRWPYAPMPEDFVPYPGSDPTPFLDNCRDSDNVACNPFD